MVFTQANFTSNLTAGSYKVKSERQPAWSGLQLMVTPLAGGPCVFTLKKKDSKGVLCHRRGDSAGHGFFRSFKKRKWFRIELRSAKQVLYRTTTTKPHMTPHRILKATKAKESLLGYHRTLFLRMQLHYADIPSTRVVINLCLCRCKW